MKRMFSPKIFRLAAAAGLIGWIYRHWFINPEIIGGDWPFYYDAFLGSVRLPPSLWSPWPGNGLGGVNLLIGLGLLQSAFIVPFTQSLGLPWPLVYKTGWFGLFILLSFVSWYRFARRVLPDALRSWWPLAGLIYSTNTYILMLAAGGQMGVALAYGMAPWILAECIPMLWICTDTEAGMTSKKLKVKSVAAAALLLGFQVMIDLRIAYVTLAGCGIFMTVRWLYGYKTNKMVRCSDGYMVSGSVTHNHPATQPFIHLISLCAALTGAFLLNAFWLLPQILLKTNPVTTQGGAFTSPESVRFFSFADFSHALSLLHPNWPENIFGKTYFLQPEFLLIPLVAFSSLLFLTIKNGYMVKWLDGFKKKKSTMLSNRPIVQSSNRLIILIFALLALLGAFLSKGANEPLGGIYIWLFEHVPGFVMFRDPTKFYVLTAVSYAVLIPFTLANMVMIFLPMNSHSEPGSSRAKSLSQASTDSSPFGLRMTHLHGVVISMLFLLCWGIFIRQAVFGNLGGTFERRQVPAEYTEHAAQLSREPGFSRSLWVPRQSRFAYVSPHHIPVEAGPLLGATDSASVARAFADPDVADVLADMAIRYVIVPSDPYGELFVEDRKYSPAKRADTEAVLDRIPWLTKTGMGDISIYKTAGTKDFMWADNAKIEWEKLSEDIYRIGVRSDVPFTLNVSQSFHPGWQAAAGDILIPAGKTANGLQSYALPAGVYSATVEFAPRRIYFMSQWASVIAFVIILGCLSLVRPGPVLYNGRKRSK